jgi:formate--tetrahydrofolate ligase
MRWASTCGASCGARHGHERPGAALHRGRRWAAGNGFPREDGFDIVVASEVMAIFCLATSLARPEGAAGPHHRRLHRDQKPIRAATCRPRRHGGAAEGRDQAEPGADAGEQPGHHARRPFANIAHGCNSVIATRRRR